MSNDIVNLGGYCFTELDRLPERKKELEDFCRNLGLKGTVFLSPEGINFSIAGRDVQVLAFENFLKEDPRFAEIRPSRTYSTYIPFGRLRIRIRKELVPG